MSSQQKAELDALMRQLPLDLGGDLGEQRPLLEQLMTSHALPADVTTTPSAHGGVAAVDITVPSADAGDVILYFHGGAYAMGSAQAAAGLAAGLPMPAAAVLMSPWADLTLSGSSITGKAATDPVLTGPGLRQRAADYAGGAGPRTPAISPVFAELEGLPPLLVQAGTHEILLDDAIRLAAAAAAADVSVTLDLTAGAPHVFQGFAALLDEGAKALARAGAFVRSHLAA